MSRVNNNAHSLTYSDSGMGQFGLGLFPLCAIFNHSCYVNCIFVSDGSQMVFRAIRPIAKGEELCVNYVGLYQSRNARRNELMLSKQFECFCRRCTFSPANEEEKKRFENDQYIGGIFCVECRERNKRGEAAGIYRETSQAMQKKAERSNDEEKCDGDESVQEGDYIMRCSQCGHTPTLAQLAAVDQAARGLVDEALSAYARDNLSVSSKRQFFETAIKELRVLVHERHEHMYTLYHPMINICGQQADYRAQLDYCRKLLTMSESCYPLNFLPVCNYLQCQANAVKKLQEGRQGSNRPSKLGERYKEERLGALKRLADIYTCCRGPDSRLSMLATSTYETLAGLR